MTKPEELKLWKVCEKAQDAAIDIHSKELNEILSRPPSAQRDVDKEASYSKLDAALAAASVAYREARSAIYKRPARMSLAASHPRPATPCKSAWSNSA